ncbi:hypothetical protein GCM10027605_49040 [Micromonospora zhanjiangensis]
MTRSDLSRVAALAARCLAHDGGLPLAAGESFLGRRFAAPGGAAWGLAADPGELLAAGAVRVEQAADGAHRAVLTGLVDPDHRGRGIGAALLDHGLARAAALADTVTVETEALTGPAADLFAGRGLRRVFAEDVLRFDLARTPLPAAPLPADVRIDTWSAQAAARFFAVYTAAFRDRPGFPGWPLPRWVDWTAGDDEFRPGWSLLASRPGLGDVGFITCAEGWVVQVGVRPDQRGRRLGAALVTEALRRMRAGGGDAVLLDVNVDNPAGELYRRLGFTPVGTRARFEPAD